MTLHHPLPRLTSRDVADGLSSIACWFIVFSALYTVHCLPGWLYLAVPSAIIFTGMLMFRFGEMVIQYVRNFSLYR